ncbi:MAG: hypothetical protein HDR33_04325 [Treponema sp.]|nr:hypothetical protein [Treponema sp.]
MKMMDAGGEKMNKEEGRAFNSTTSKFEILFKYYEKAIEGRNFHYQNYNTWANYYSIFTGALFIGYYTVLNLKDCNTTFFKFLIILIGLMTSICWNLTVRGHYHWMLSWIKIVQDYEKKLANFLKKNGMQGYFVYSVYAERCENGFHKNISSQKLTSRFTFSVSIAWAFLLVSPVYDFLCNFKAILNFCCVSYCFCIVSVLISSVVTFLLYLIIYLIFDNPSDVSKMKETIKG